MLSSADDKFANAICNGPVIRPSDAEPELREPEPEPLSPMLVVPSPELLLLFRCFESGCTSIAKAGFGLALTNIESASAIVKSDLRTGRCMRCLDVMRRFSKELATDDE